MTRTVNPDSVTHRALARWAAECAARTLAIFEDCRPGDGRPRAAIEALRAWEQGDLPMTVCRAAAFAAHAAAREAVDADTSAPVAAARAAGQAAAVAHMSAHAPHAAVYAAKAVGLHGGSGGDDVEDRLAERAWQWANLEPELRPLGFPQGPPAND